MIGTLFLNGNRLWRLTKVYLVVALASAFGTVLFYIHLKNRLLIIVLAILFLIGLRLFQFYLRSSNRRMEHRHDKPPSLAFFLIVVMLPHDDTLYVILGDLAEGYYHLSQDSSKLVAKLWYWRQTVSLIPLALRRLLYQGTHLEGLVKKLKNTI